MHLFTSKIEMTHLPWLYPSLILFEEPQGDRLGSLF